MLRISNAGNLIDVLRDHSHGTHWHQVIFDTKGLGDRRARKHAAMKRRDEMKTAARGYYQAPTYAEYVQHFTGVIKSVSFTITLTLDDS